MKRNATVGKAKYEIKVSALGYDTTTLVVEAKNLREAKKSEREAVNQWLAHNDADYATRGLAFVHYSLI